MCVHTISMRKNSMHVNGKFRKHVRYADHVVLIAKTAAELQIMTEALRSTSEKKDLRINVDKTKIVIKTGENININIKGDILEQI